MTSSSDLSNGTTAYSWTTAAGAADTVTFPDRYGYVTVTNESASGVLSVRTDGAAATEASVVPGTDCYPVLPGETRMLANALPLWYQSSNVILAGELVFGRGNTSDSPAAPGEVTAQESLAGQVANPGTHVSLISSAAVQYTVAAAG